MNTQLFLCKVDFNNKYEHTIHFDNKEQQLNYFYTRSRWNTNDFNYIKKDDVIKVAGLDPEALDYNYCYFINSDQLHPKYIYAFIKDIKFLSHNGVTEIYIETDVIQTYYFDYKIGKCFVEREHVINDVVGLHTYPEQLELGPYMCNGVVRDNNMMDYCYVMMVTESPIKNEANWDELISGGIIGELIFGSDSTSSDSSKPLATNFGGIISAGGAFVFLNTQQLVAVVQHYAEIGKVDAITAVYMLPKKFLEEDNDDGTLTYKGKAEPVKYEITIDKQQKIDEDFYPVNKKLLTYPYNYLLVSNNAGTSNVLKYENFSTSKCVFEIEGIPSIGGSIKCVPKDYNGIALNQEEGIIAGKFPTLSWSADLYTNWLTQNAVNNTIGIVGGVIATAGGIATGNPIAAIGGIASITNQLTQIYEQSFTPNSARGNVNAGDINTANKMNTFHFYKMSIKPEYARIIDDYFSMYGYKINQCKVPNKNHRKHFWFTKLNGANISGAIPTNYLNKIIEIYEKGITFWRSTSTFRDYQEDNTTI